MLVCFFRSLSLVSPVCEQVNNVANYSARGYSERSFTRCRLPLAYSIVAILTRHVPSFSVLVVDDAILASWSRFDPLARLLTITITYERLCLCTQLDPCQKAVSSELDYEHRKVWRSSCLSLPLPAVTCSHFLFARMLCCTVLCYVIGGQSFMNIPISA